MDKRWEIWDRDCQASFEFWLYCKCGRRMTVGRPLPRDPEIETYLDWEARTSDQVGSPRRGVIMVAVNLGPDPTAPDYADCVPINLGRKSRPYVTVKVDRSGAGGHRDTFRCHPRCGMRRSVLWSKQVEAYIRAREAGGDRLTLGVDF